MGQNKKKKNVKVVLYKSDDKEGGRFRIRTTNVLRWVSINFLCCGFRLSLCNCQKSTKLLLLFFQFNFVGKLDRADLPALGFMVVLPSAIK